MARTPPISIHYSQENCGDCGHRKVALPDPLPPIGDDFDWLVRDYDGFRLFMLEELAARYPERKRWTPADLEVVLVEALSVILDQYSDQLDRISQEAYLETARRPQSVRRLLNMVGYDPVRQSAADALLPQAKGSSLEDGNEKQTRLSRFIPYFAALLEKDHGLSAAQQTTLETFTKPPANLPATDRENLLNRVQLFLDQHQNFVNQTQIQALERYWALHPQAMEAARSAGPRAIRTQKRMVTLQDYATGLAEHPIVLRAQAFSKWSGTWETLYAAVICAANASLDSPLESHFSGNAEAFEEITKAIESLHRQVNIQLPDWTTNPTSRTILRPYLDARRLAGQEVFLLDAEPVGIQIVLSVRAAENYFQSELRQQLEASLGTGVGGFFEPGRLRFGEDLHASDIIEWVMSIKGIKAVCLNRFKREGRRYPDQSQGGSIQLDGREVAVCGGAPGDNRRGYLQLMIHGGRPG